MLAGCLLMSTATFAQTPAVARPDYSAFRQSVLIPFSNQVDFNNLKSLRVHASINGGPTGEFVVDTGSVGIIVAADDVPNIDPNGPHGEITYSSSGVHLEGTWTQATVTFPDAHGGKAMALVAVLAVSKKSCTGSGVNAAHCTASDHPHTHMMGIGFGRGKETGSPQKNPFLNLREMQAGSMRRGYAITRDGITLGLTDQVAGAGYVWQKLTERPVSAETHAAGTSLKDWDTAPGSFRIRDAQAGPGTVLVDTGLTNMIMAATEATPGTDVKDGVPLTIDLLGGQLHYTFTSGDAANPQAPRRISWVRQTHGLFVNTGLRALARFDYMFDADGGWLAMRATKP